MTIEIQGNWVRGYVFDVHTLSSTYLGPNEFGHAQFDTKYSEMGELIHRLKYKHDRAALPRIVELLDKFTGIEEFDFLIPIPPTDKSRAFQPVTEIARALGRRRGVDVLYDFLAKKPGGLQLKDVSDPEERETLLRDSIYVDAEYSIEGRTVLLVDDLYRSGATFRISADLLNKANAARVCVLAMTKTRSKR
jgi:competence protein ComFC